MRDLFDPGALLREAERLERAGRLVEAEAAYAQLLSRWPDAPNTWYNLAMLQRRAGRYEAALASYAQALARGISEPEQVHLNRGVIFSDCLRQDAAAEKELQAALALNPAYVPALFNLANRREDFGRRDEALALYERILALNPHSYEALARAAGLWKVSGPDDAQVERVRRAIADARSSAMDKASLGFALGKMLDACGAYDAAFAAYTQANRHSRQSASPGTGVYDRKRHEKLIDELIGTFDSAAPVSPGVDPTPRPVFICGMFRSGSTLAEQVLASHPRIRAGGELALLPTMVRADLAPFPASMRSVTPQRLQLLAGLYIEQLRRLVPEGDHVTDKRPDNFLYIGLIKRLFPHARIVHTTRNALDNCLSIHFLHLDHTMAYALDLDDTAHYYVQYRRLMAHWKRLYGPDILDFDYDALVREPRARIGELLAFCGLEWDERCMSFHEADNSVRTASVWQVREPLYRRSSGRWRNYAAHIGSIRAYLRAHCQDLDLG